MPVPLLLHHLQGLYPTLAVTVRRLHDTGLSAWWSLGLVVSVICDLAGYIGVLRFNPILLPIGAVLRVYDIVLIVFMALPSNSGDNRYGTDPR